MATGEQFANEDELEESVWANEDKMAEPDKAKKTRKRRTKASS